MSFPLVARESAVADGDDASRVLHDEAIVRGEDEGRACARR